MVTYLLLLVQLTDAPTGLASAAPLSERKAVALGEGASAPSGGGPKDGDSAGGGGGGGGAALSDEDALQARLDALRRG